MQAKDFVVLLSRKNEQVVIDFVESQLQKLKEEAKAKANNNEFVGNFTISGITSESMAKSVVERLKSLGFDDVYSTRDYDSKIICNYIVEFCLPV